MRLKMYKKRTKKRIVLSVMLVFAMLSVYLFFERVYPNYISRVDIYMENEGTKLINSALLDANTGKRNFEKISVDNSGHVTAIEADTYQMNLFKAEFTQKLYEKVQDTEPGFVVMPLGSLLREEMFSGIGPKIRIKTEINGVVKSNFKENFVSCGINQVKHKIYLEISVSFYAVSAFMHRSKTVSAEIPVSETVIAGTVPYYYGNGAVIAYGNEAAAKISE